MIDRCPHCSSTDGYSFKDYGHTIFYTGRFGQGRAGEEATEMKSKSKPPVYAYCDSCGKKIKLSMLRGENDGN